jgi:hypothetical protein
MTIGVDAETAVPGSAVGIAIRSPVVAAIAKVNRCPRAPLSLICIASGIFAFPDGRLYPGGARNCTAVTLAREGLALPSAAFVSATWWGSGQR